VAGALGWQLLPWQQQVADVALEVDPRTGEWAHPLVVFTVQRQAGKTVLVGANSIHRCLAGPDRECWFTQQDRTHARAAFMKLVKRVRRGVMGPPFTKIRESNGSESITFPNGSSYGIFAPSEDALHGTTNALVNIDEAWSFDDVRGTELVQAILPTFATVDGQLWIFSAAGNHHSTWLRSLVDAGRLVAASGATTGMAYFEWGIGDDVDTADLAAVAAAHPASGYTLRPTALADASRIMTAEEFARAYGNRWSTTGGESVIPTMIWALAADDLVTRLPEPGMCCLGLDVGRDGADTAIVAAWRDDDGTGHVELVDVRTGTGWVVQRLAELVGKLKPRAILYDRLGPALAVGDACARARLRVSVATFEDVAGAASAFLTGLSDRTIRVRPHPALDAAAAAASRRMVGDRWVWDRREANQTVAALIAATLALWGFDHAPRPPRFTVR
jgi:hypothetical protein